MELRSLSFVLIANMWINSFRLKRDDVVAVKAIEYRESVKPIISTIDEVMNRSISIIKSVSLAIFDTFNIDDLISIAKEFLLIDVIGEFKSIYRKIKSAFESFIKIIKNIHNRGIAQLVKELWGVLSGLPSKLRDMIKSNIESLKTMSNKELLVSVVKTAITTIIFLSVGYVGYSIPDLDISLVGIGSHRNWLTHSIVPVLFVSLSSKLLIRFLERAKKRHSKGDADTVEAFRIIQKGLNTLSVSFAFGVSVHLLQDALLDNPQTVRGPWERNQIPDFLRTNYRFDDGYLVANGLLAMNSVKK